MSQMTGVETLYDDPFIMEDETLHVAGLYQLGTDALISHHAALVSGR
jgi:hypothetical protein